MCCATCFRSFAYVFLRTIFASGPCLVADVRTHNGSAAKLAPSNRLERSLALRYLGKLDIDATHATALTMASVAGQTSSIRVPCAGR